MSLTEREDIMGNVHIQNDFSGNKAWKIATKTEQNYSCCHSACREQKEFSLHRNLYCCCMFAMMS